MATERLISADGFVEDIKTEIMNLYLDGKKGTPRPREELYAIIDRINEQPTVDAVEVVHGRWEQVQRWATKAKYRCSVCGREIMSAVKVNIEKYPYCHCGAKMDGDGNGN